MLANFFIRDNWLNSFRCYLRRPKAAAIFRRNASDRETDPSAASITYLIHSASAPGEAKKPSLFFYFSSEKVSDLALSGKTPRAILLYYTDFMPCKWKNIWLLGKDLFHPPLIGKLVEGLTLLPKLLLASLTPMGRLALTVERERPVSPLLW